MKGTPGNPATWPKKINPGQCLCGAGSHSWHVVCYQAVPMNPNSPRSVMAHAASKVKA